MLRPIIIATGAAVGTGGITDFLGADKPLAAAFAVIVGLLVWVVKAAHSTHDKSLKAWSDASDKDRDLYREESAANRDTFSAGLKDITTEIRDTGCRYRE